MSRSFMGHSMGSSAPADDVSHEADPLAYVTVKLAKSGYTYEAPVTEVRQDGGVVFVSPFDGEEYESQAHWLSALHAFIQYKR